MIKGPKGLARALVPLVLRELVFVSWSLTDAVQWMPAKVLIESNKLIEPVFPLHYLLGEVK